MRIRKDITCCVSEKAGSSCFFFFPFIHLLSLPQLLKGRKESGEGAVGHVGICFAVSLLSFCSFGFTFWPGRHRTHHAKFISFCFTHSVSFCSVFVDILVCVLARRG